MKKEIINWLNSNRDFTAGYVLFNKYSKNRNLKKLMAGRHKFAKKLAWELAKLAGVSLGDFQQKEPIKMDTGNRRPETGDGKKQNENGNKDNGDGKELPNNVRLLLHVYQEVYQLRSSLHKKMKYLPEDNSDKVVKQRKELSDNIKECSDKLDILWTAREEWEKEKKIPSDEFFKDARLSLQKSKNEDEKKTKGSISDKDKFSLLKRKKNLESSLAKDRNMLLYQVKTKQEKEKPMPDGPKRKKIEERVSEKEKELKEINETLGDGKESS